MCSRLVFCMVFMNRSFECAQRRGFALFALVDLTQPWTSIAFDRRSELSVKFSKICRFLLRVLMANHVAQVQHECRNTSLSLAKTPQIPHVVTKIFQRQQFHFISSAFESTRTTMFSLDKTTTHTHWTPSKSQNQQDRIQRQRTQR